MHALDMESVVPRICALVNVIGKDPIALFVSFRFNLVSFRFVVGGFDWLASSSILAHCSPKTIISISIQARARSESPMSIFQREISMLPVSSRIIRQSRSVDPPYTLTELPKVSLTWLILQEH